MSNIASNEEELERRYRRSFGRVAGYLPKNRTAIDEWHEEMAQQVAQYVDAPRQSPSVIELARLIETDAVVRMYVTEMIDEVDAAHRHIHNIPQLLTALDQIVRSAPRYNRDPGKQNTFPMSSLFTYMMMTPAGEAAFRNAAFNRAIRVILQEWCRFLDSAASCDVLNEGEYGWLSQPAYEQNKLSEFVIQIGRAHV